MKVSKRSAYCRSTHSQFIGVTVRAKYMNARRAHAMLPSCADWKDVATSRLHDVLHLRSSVGSRGPLATISASIQASLA
jgi:hypothetical protein